MKKLTISALCFFLRFSVPVKFRSRQVYEFSCVRATHQLWTVQSAVDSAEWILIDLGAS